MMEKTYRNVAAMRKTAVDEATRNSLIGAGIGGLAGGGAGALGANILARLLDASDENRRKATLLAGLLLGGAGAAQGAFIGNIGTRAAGKVKEIKRRIEEDRENSALEHQKWLEATQSIEEEGERIRGNIKNFTDSYPR